MASRLSPIRIKLMLTYLNERLWVRPLLMCLLSIAAVLGARLADDTSLASITPGVAFESVETLLSIMAAGMLVIATFSVGSMVSAYVSASTTATPRSFSLVVADDASQNALSTFVGAFIFSIVSITALQNEYFGDSGLFVLFVMTLLVFAAVILTFVRWVDRIARLGLLGSTIEKAEAATAAALKRRKQCPHLGARPLRETGSGNDPVSVKHDGQAIYADTVGYVQDIDMEALQVCAEEHKLMIMVVALPGTFATPARALAYVVTADGSPAPVPAIVDAFKIGSKRLFQEDPRFGLLILSEIACRALSPGINDPGTAIGIVATFVRLFVEWDKPDDELEVQEPVYNRIMVPALCIDDMFDDAFSAVARDGASKLEVGIKLQKAFQALALSPDRMTRTAARRHSSSALARARLALELPQDVETLEAVAALHDTD